MRAALGILLALLTLEGLMLLVWPVHVKAIINEVPSRVLRALGVVEIILVLVILLLVFRLV